MATLRPQRQGRARHRRRARDRLRDRARAASRAARASSIVDLDLEAAQRAAAELGDESRALGLAADVTDRGAMQRAVATTVERSAASTSSMANAGHRQPRARRCARCPPRASTACST